LLFVKLLTPWIVMALVAVIASVVLSLPDYAAIIIALVAALATTFLIRDFERKGRIAGRR
jgi:ABC-type transport system involved in cytochrome bd biosynthesis fused ATPase/permease subunit